MILSIGGPARPKLSAEREAACGQSWLCGRLSTGGAARRPVNATVARIAAEMRAGAGIINDVVTINDVVNID